MRNLIWLWAAVFAVTVLFGCGGKGTIQDSPTAVPTASPVLAQGACGLTPPLDALDTIADKQSSVMLLERTGSDYAVGLAQRVTNEMTFARLIRVRVGVKLIETEDPRQLAALVTAAAKLPGWVFGEVEPAAKQTGDGVPKEGVYLDQEDGLPDISAMSMQEAITEAKELIAELEKPAKVKVL